MQYLDWYNHGYCISDTDLITVYLPQLVCQPGGRVEAGTWDCWRIHYKEAWVQKKCHAKLYWAAISRAWQPQSKTDACGDSQHNGNMKEWETPRETGNENMKTLVFSVATKETFSPNACAKPESSHCWWMHIFNTNLTFWDLGKSGIKNYLESLASSSSGW